MHQVKLNQLMQLNGKFIYPKLRFSSKSKHDNDYDIMIIMRVPGSHGRVSLPIMTFF
uniref:Uncharacterized protein n=1 Tax=Rhizophagus irregularis (strain DAOM 181602 / DAOM 197198 / MUCL 43194) TaxID=747089 RepID=U9TGI3_RHIID